MKKVPNSIQNTRCLATPASTLNGVAKVICIGGASGATGVPAGAPYGARPTSLGRLRISRNTSTATSAQASSTGTTAIRQP